MENKTNKQFSKWAVFATLITLTCPALFSVINIILKQSLEISIIILGMYFLFLLIIFLYMLKKGSDVKTKNEIIEQQKKEYNELKQENLKQTNELKEIIERLNIKINELTIQVDTANLRVDELTAAYVITQEMLENHELFGIISKFFTEGYAEFRAKVKGYHKAKKIPALIILKVKFLFFQIKLKEFINNPLSSKTAGGLLEEFTNLIYTYNKISKEFGCFKDFIDKFEEFHADSIGISSDLMTSLIHPRQSERRIKHNVLTALIPAFKQAIKEMLYVVKENSEFEKKCIEYNEKNGDKVIFVEDITTEKIIEMIRKVG